MVATLLNALSNVQPGPEFPLLYASALAFLLRGGERISTMDLLIATSALEARAPLVTRNLREFQRVPDLEVIGY